MTTRLKSDTQNTLPRGNASQVGGCPGIGGRMLSEWVGGCSGIRIHPEQMSPFSTREAPPWRIGWTAPTQQSFSQIVCAICVQSRKKVRNARYSCHICSCSELTLCPADRRLSGKMLCGARMAALVKLHLNGGTLSQCPVRAGRVLEDDDGLQVCCVRCLRTAALGSSCGGGPQTGRARRNVQDFSSPTFAQPVF